MKRFRLPLIILAVILVVVVALPQLFTLNRFKELAASEVQKATGRTLDIAGDIRISIFPVLGANVEKISLSNPPGSEYPSMFSAEEASIGVKLIPLLSGKVELGRIILIKPMVYLEKNAEGKANWEFPKKEATAEDAPAAVGEEGKKPAIVLEGVEIHDGVITYHDSQKKTAIELSEVNMEASIRDMESPATVEVSAKWQGTPVQLYLETESPTALMAESGSRTTLKASAYGLGGELKGLASVTPNLVSIKQLEISALDIAGTGEVALATGGEVPEINATLQLGKVNLKPLMALSGAAAAASGGENAGAADVAPGKKGLLAADAFKAINGVIALSAEEVTGDGFVLTAPKVKASLSGGAVKLDATGAYAQDGQEGVTFAFDSAALQQILSGEGGPFSLAATRGKLKADAGGRLGLGPKRVDWQDATLKINDQSMTGRVSADFGAAKPKIAANLNFTVLDVEKLKALAGAAGGAAQAAGEGAPAAEAKSAAPDLSALQKLDADVTVKAGTLVAGGQKVEGFALTADTGKGSLDAVVSGTWLKDKERWKFSAKSAQAEKILTSDGGPFSAEIASAAQALKLAGMLSYEGGSVTLDPFTLVTNGGEGKGSLRYDADGGKPSLTASMSFDSLDLNPLLALAGDGKEDKAPASAGGAQAQAKAASPLDAMNAEIRFKAKRMKVKNIQATDAALNANLKDGNLALEVPGVGLYGGTASLKADVKGQAFTAALKGDKVDLGALLKGGAGTSAFEGIGDFDFDVTGNGLEAPALYKTLNGKGTFAIKDMVISGMDALSVASQIRGLKSDSIVTQSGSSRMDAKGTLTIVNGVAQNDDLEATGPNVQMKGKGNINLPAWTINFRLDPKLGETRKNEAGEEKFVGTQVPVLIEGSLDKPKVYPDPKALLKTGLDALGTIKELGIGDKVKGVSKYLTPLLGGEQEQPQEGAPAQPEAAEPQVEEPASAPDAATQPQQPNPVEQLQQLFNR